MRGPVGLFAPPDNPQELGQFVHTDENGIIEVFVERALLASPHLKNNELLVNVEGYGRFRLYFGSQRSS